MGSTFLGDQAEADRIAVVNGSGTALELLFYILCDPGDGVLVPTPSYTGFWSDIETRDEVVIIPVHTSHDDEFQLSIELLDAAIETAVRPVNVLLYTNPNNPLGRVDPPEKVDELLTWGEARGIHVVIDEVYALSVFGEDKFVSGAELRTEMSDWLHIVWVFSKDFALSGFRSGLIYTHNERLHRAVDLLSYWAPTSGDTQSLLCQVIADRPWVDWFLAENRRRLADAYRQVTAVFDSYGIGYIPGGAGFFFLIDVRPYMDEQTWEAEDRLWHRILNEIKVNITPGSACRNPEPGFMRVVFACAPTEAAVEGAGRVGRFLSSLLP